MFLFIFYYYYWMVVFCILNLYHERCCPIFTQNSILLLKHGMEVSTYPVTELGVAAVSGRLARA